MKFSEEFYLRNKKIFDKLGIFKEKSAPNPSERLDLTSSSAIDGFIKKLSRPSFLGSDLSGSQGNDSSAYAQLIRKQAFNQEFLRRVSWFFSNPVLKGLLIAWGLLNVIMILLFLL